MVNSVNKPKILFVPAWYPCSFFEEQQAVYADQYDIYNIIGSCTWLSKKKQVCRLLSLSSVSSVKSKIKYDICHIEISCPKYKSVKRTENAIRRLSDQLGSLILNMTRGHKLECVYLQSISDLAIFVVDWAKRNGIKVILAEHILYIRHSLNYVTSRREQLFQLADKVFCVSNYLYRNLLTSGFRMKSVSVVGNLVNAHGIPTNWEKLQKNGRIMFVATHLNDKDIETLIDVAVMIKPKGLKIDIYGLSGDEMSSKCETVSQYVINKGVSNVITFVGRLSHEELLKKYSQYSLLVSTSQSETFGLAVAEAIAHGTIVVCTDSGGIRDFVNNSNGRIVSIKDVEGLYNAIMNLWNVKIDYNCISQQILDKYGYLSYKKNVII